VVKNIGKPCAGKPHARFDEGGLAKAVTVRPLRHRRRKGWKRTDRTSIRGNQLYYITATKDRRRPLDYAMCRIFPHGVRIKFSNYELSPNKSGYLSLERRGFMPTED